MTEPPASLLRRAVNRIRERDPEFDAMRRALRAAIVVPLAAALSFAVAGNSQTPLFTLFGSFALLVLADFPGNRQTRAVAYAGLGINGAVLITLGTLVSPHAWLAVGLMFVLGVAVMFAGVLSETIAAGQRPTLLTFVLPACTPPGPIDERLMGWAIALAVCVPAALFLLAATPLRGAAQARGQRGHRIGGPPRGQGHPRRSGAGDAGPAGELPRRGLPARRAVRRQPRTRAGGRGPRMARRSGQRRGGSGAARYAGTRHPGAAVFGCGASGDQGGRSHD